MRRGLRNANISPEEKLRRAKEGLAEDNMNVEAMLVIVESPLAEKEEKSVVLKGFFENAQEIIKKNGLFEEEISGYKTYDETHVAILFLYCADEQENRGMYEAAFHVYETALALTKEGPRRCHDYGIRKSCMNLSVRCGDLESAEKLCEVFPDDSDILLLTSFLFYRENRLDKAKEYLNKCRDTNIFTEEFIKMMLDEDRAAEFSPNKCSPVHAMHEFISLVQRNRFLLERDDFFGWADGLIREEMIQRENSGKHEKNCFVYEMDFLKTDDVTHYYKWDQAPGMLIKDGKLYMEHAGELLCRGSADERAPLFGAVEGIPDETYIAWKAWRSGNRAGYALVRFKGQWRIAIRTENSPYTDGYTRICPYAESCMCHHMMDMAKEKRFHDFIFVFSGTDKRRSWPPQQMRAWVLLPERLYKGWAFLSESESIRYRIECRGCKKEPNECRFAKMMEKFSETEGDT